MITSIKNPLSLLEKEEDIIISQMYELQNIIEDKIINYPNLITTLKTIYKNFDNYEAKRQEIVAILNESGYSIQLEEYSFEKSPELVEWKIEISKALHSGKDRLVKESLVKYGKSIIKSISEKFEEIEWIFCSVDWEALKKDALDEIRLIQIIPNLRTEKGVKQNEIFRGRF